MSSRSSRDDIYNDRVRDVLDEISKLEYALMNNISILPNKKYIHTAKDEEEEKTTFANDQQQTFVYKSESDLSLANGPLSDMVDHLTPFRETIGARRREYIDHNNSNGGDHLKKGIKIDVALKRIWRDVIDFSFVASNDNVLKDTITNRLVNLWKVILKDMLDLGQYFFFSNVTEKRRSSVLILLRVIENIVDANMQHPSHFIRDAVLCRLIRGAVKSTVPISTVMQYIPLCTETMTILETIPQQPALVSEAHALELRIKGVYGYGNFYPKNDDDYKIAVRDICSDYILKLLFEFLLSPHIHPTWKEAYLITFISFVQKLICNHEPFILALSKNQYKKENDGGDTGIGSSNIVINAEEQNNYISDIYFTVNKELMLKHKGCHPFIFLPTATDFWSFCKNGQPIYNVKNILINARPSSFPPVCGGPAGISQGKQLAWEKFCQRQGICSNDGCDCSWCQKRKMLVERVRQRMRHISGEARLTDVTKWHQGPILMVNFYAFTGFLAHHNYAGNMDDKADFFKNLILVIEKSYHARNSENFILSGGSDYDTSNILHVIMFGIEEEFRQKLKSPQKKTIFVTASINDDILEGDNISEIQLVTLRERKASEFGCWF